MLPCKLVGISFCSVFLTETWSSAQQHAIDEAVDEWRRRFPFLVSAEDVHFEYKL